MKKLKTILMNETVRLYALVTLLLGSLLLPSDYLLGLTCIGVSVVWVLLITAIDILEGNKKQRNPRNLEVLLSGKRLRKARLNKVEKVEVKYSKEELDEVFDGTGFEQLDGIKDNSKFD